MIVTGKYEKDDNFIYLYANNVMYTIAVNASEWGSLKVGERSASGQIFTQEVYNKYVSECEKVGTFELK